MKTKKRKQTEDSEGTAVFAAIPMEKLSGLDETLWLDQISAKKAPHSHKNADKGKKNSG